MGGDAVPLAFSTVASHCDPSPGSTASLGSGYSGIAMRQHLSAHGDGHLLGFNGHLQQDLMGSARGDGQLQQNFDGQLQQPIDGADAVGVIRASLSQCRVLPEGFRWFIELGGLSGGRLAPPASPRRHRAYRGDNLTQPRRHHTFVEDCRRALRAVHPRLVWSYDSARQHTLRVREVVERAMTEEMIPVGEKKRPDPRFARKVRGSIDDCRPDLCLSSPTGVEMLPDDGGQDSPALNLKADVKLIGDFDLVKGDGPVSSVSQAGVSTMDRGTKLSVEL
ncbi:hypothetical protein Dimus_030461 [Dionaea muscipula]